jgi:hypothetical protein
MVPEPMTAAVQFPNLPVVQESRLADPVRGDEKMAPARHISRYAGHRGIRAYATVVKGEE